MTLQRRAPAPHDQDRREQDANGQVIPLASATRKPSVDEALRQIVREEIAGALAELELGTHEAPPALLTSEQCARELGISVVHLRSLVKSGLPVRHLGDAKRYFLPDVLEWCRAQPAPERGAT